MLKALLACFTKHQKVAGGEKVCVRKKKNGKKKKRKNGKKKNGRIKQKLNILQFFFT